MGVQNGQSRGENAADISIQTTGEYGENLQTDRAGDGERGERR